jgi:4-methylaminobutanoate oxidase (formaldehyde-forming)
MDKPVGSVIYTQLCNERGGIEADVTITRLGENHFYLVTGSAFGVHDSDWIRRNMPKDGSVHLIEVTSARAVINICGPKARAVLQSVTEEDISNDAFPFATAQNIIVGAAPVRAVRIGYVGELGWELHVPTEYAAHVYETLASAGKAHGIIDAGYRTIESLRVEKGYLYWSSDITPDYTPYEAGLGGRVHLKSKGDFIGRAALERQKAEGVKRTLCTFVADGMLPVYGGETIMLDGKVVSLASAAAFGHTLQKTIFYGYLPVEMADRTDFTVETFGNIYPVVRTKSPLYDPENLRLKA